MAPATKPTVGPQGDVGRQPKLRARVLVREDVVFCPAGDQSVRAADGNHSYGVDPDEITLTRVYKVGTEWRDLEFGDISAPSQVHLESQEGQYPQRIPYPAELAELALKTVEVGVAFDCHHGDDVNIVPAAVVRAGRSCRFEPVPGQKYLVRSQHGTVKLHVVVFPNNVAPPAPEPTKS